MGLSFGGYLAPRAAAVDPRIHVLIADPGVLDWSASMLRHFESIPGLMGLQAMSPAAFDRTIELIGTTWPDAAWYFEDATRKHGVQRPHELLADLRRYTDVGHAARVRCKTLLMDGVAEDASPGQARALYAALGGPKHLLEFDAASAAQTHCQAGGTLQARARLFDWLDEDLGRA